MIRHLTLLLCLVTCTPLVAETTTVRVGAWNIEWLGKPQNRSGEAQGHPQSAEDLAAYIQASEVSLLALEEICDDDGSTSTRTNTTLSRVMTLLSEGGDAEWHYVLFPKKEADDEEQHLGVAWDARQVTRLGEPARLPVNTDHPEFNLLERIPHAVPISLGNGKTDLVVIPLHLKSNRGGVSRTRKQRREEAKRIVQALSSLTDPDDVLLGDINVLHRQEPAVTTLQRAGFRDLNPDDEPTLAHGDAPFDRIFVPASQPEFSSEPVEVFSQDDLSPEEHRKRLSDHYMVITTVRVQPDDDTGETLPQPGQVAAAALDREFPSAHEGVETSLEDGSAGEEVTRTSFPDLAEKHRVSGLENPFRLSQDFPRTYNVHEVFPWEEIDFRTHPKAYIESVLKYCLEGNSDNNIDFRVQDNPVRKWYHAPWFHDDGVPNGAGREAHHGMTRERRSRPFELHANQKSYAQNWAVGFYNDRGAFTLGNVWPSADLPPNPYAANFPDHTVAFKLLFTDASVEEVPYLERSKEWTANIYADTEYKLPRVDRTMRLLQIDIAVKDPRVASEAGWIFGTFIYDASQPGKDVFERMAYVGLSWDDDEGVSSRICSGAFDNPELGGTVINTGLLAAPKATNQATMLHLGLGGRLNGPVDNPISSCISCHGRAAVAATSSPSPLERGQLMAFFNAAARTPNDFSQQAFSRFFRSVRPGAHLEEDTGKIYVTTDYSQQVAVGIRNYYALKLMEGREGAAMSALEGVDAEPATSLPLGTRGED